MFSEINDQKGQMSESDSERHSSSSSEDEEIEKKNEESSDDDDSSSSSTTSSSNSDSETSSSEDSEGSDEFDQEMFTLDDDIINEAARKTIGRMGRAQVQMTPGGKYTYSISTNEIASARDKRPWEIVNPMGQHPDEMNKSIFNYDLSQLPNTVEAKPWTAPDADITQWFNYGFTETTWEKYRKKILKVIDNKNLDTRIKTLTVQTKG